MSKKYWIEKQRNVQPFIAHGIAGHYQSLTLRQISLHLNKKDKRIAELEKENEEWAQKWIDERNENKALREAARAVLEDRMDWHKALTLKAALKEAEK